MTRREFEKVVREAIEGLPAEFRDRISDIAVVIEDEPSGADLRGAGIRKGTLYGLFHGVPLKKQSHLNAPMLPDRIALYQGPLERDFRSGKELAEQIRKTVLHEVGHFFGLSERDLRKLGYG